MSNVGDVKIVKYRSEWEATAAFISAARFWFGHPRKITSWVFYALIGFSGFSTIAHWTAQTIKAELAPAMSFESPATLMPEALAGVLGDTITVNGTKYGIKDVNFEVWKLDGQAAIIAWERTSGAVLKIPVPALARSELKRFDK